jgi:hypothetical protein
MRWRRTTSLCLGIVTVFMLAMSATTPLGELEAQPVGPVPGGTTPKKPLLLFGLWGFGDFQGRPCSVEEGGKVVPIPKGHRMGTWSGCSKEWKDDALDIKDFNTIVVQAEGAGTIKFGQQHDQKMMKWFVRWPGQAQDTTLICATSELRSSSDREWVVPVDGKFEYRLPEEAVRAGKLIKIGFTLLEGATYGNVRIKAWLSRQ